MIGRIHLHLFQMAFSLLVISIEQRKYIKGKMKNVENRKILHWIIHNCLKSVLVVMVTLKMSVNLSKKHSLKNKEIHNFNMCCIKMFT